MEESKQLLRVLILKADKLDSRLNANNVTLAKLTCIVEEHQLRSSRMEGVQKACREKCDSEIKATEAIVKRVDITLMKAYAMFKAVTVILSGIAGSVAVIVGGIKIFEFFNH